jgi:RNA polymerase sigma factor (sigma-70 family)
VEDAALLAAFVDQRSEQAFNDIVRQHIAMVYAVCRRQLHDAHLAEDATQAVFILLARKAGTLPPNVVLGGWLYRTAVYACSNARALQRTRTYHENRVTPMNTSPDEDDPLARMETEGLLDEGLMQLSKSQREVIVLRFFEEKTLAQVAATRHQSLHATQKSLNAGMANLRRFLSQRGVAVSLAAVGTLLAAQSAKAVPAGLATSIGVAALHGNAALSAPVAQLLARLAHHAGRAKLLASLATAALLAALGLHFLPATSAATPQFATLPTVATATPSSHATDLAALQQTLRQANLALRDMNLPALNDLLAFRNPVQAADWQRMATLFQADLVLRRAAAARFGPTAPTLTAIPTFADRLDQVLPTVDAANATWSIDEDAASLHFDYRTTPAQSATLFFLKTDGHWRIDATRSADIALEGLDAHAARAPLHALSPEAQSRTLATLDRLHQALAATADRIHAGEIQNSDEARQELQLADAPADARAFFRLALRTEDDSPLR